MKKRLFSLLVLGAMWQSLTEETALFAQADELSAGVPLRVWATALSGSEEEDIEISYTFSTGTMPSGPGAIGYWENKGGPRTWVYRSYSGTYVKANLEVLADGFLPWKLPSLGALPAARSDGTVENGVTAESPNQEMTVDLGILRVLPGKTYTIATNTANLMSALLNVSPPPGFTVIMNNMRRNACPIADQVTIRVLPIAEGPTWIAGFASSAASSGVGWKLALGSLLNGKSAGSIELCDAGAATDLAGVFTPAALHYEAVSDEVFVYRDNDILRQVIANQVAVDIVTLSSTSYEIRCYSPLQIQSYVPCSFSGQPFVVYRIEKGADSTTDSTAVELKFTRFSRNIPSAEATNVPVARTETMTVRRSGHAPGYSWIKTDWTVLNQTPLVGTTVRPPDSAPIITSQPAGQVVASGVSCTLSVAATGYPVPTYQWKKDGSALTGETSYQLKFGSFQSANAGNYTVTASNSGGSVTSVVAKLELPPGGSVPVITMQPAGKSIIVGRPVWFDVVATGSGTLTYQWKKNGSAIGGATTTQLVLGAVQSSDADNYTVTVTNSYGSTTSEIAALTVLPVRTEARAVAAPGGAMALSAARTYTTLSCGEELTGETVGTTSPRSVGFVYNTDSAQPGSFGYIKTVTTGDGGWESYDYYDTTLPSGYQIGQVKFRYRPYGTAPETPTQDPSRGEVIYYEYDTDAHGARTRMKRTDTFVNGTRISTQSTGYSSTLVAYYPYYMYTVDAISTVYSADGTALSTTTTFMAENSTDALIRGQPLAIIKPDGVKQLISYERGTWNGSTFTSNAWQFPLNNSQHIFPGTGPCSRINVITTTTGGHIANKSTTESTIRDHRALVVRTESYVWNGTTWELISWSNFGYNVAGLLTSRISSNGGVYSATYDGLLKTSETDESGVTTGYLYDAAGRVSLVTRAGSGDIGSLSTRSTYNAAGQVIEKRVGVGLSEQLVSTSAYDLAGRIVSETSPGIAATTHAYDVQQRLHTITKPDGGTIIEAKNIDGRVASKTGTAVVPEYVTYGVDPTTTQLWTQTNKGTATSRRWQRVYKDWLGREVASVSPVVGSSAVTFDGNFDSTSIRLARKYYNDTTAGASKGKLIKSTETGMAATFYEYDALGRPFRTGLDVTGDGSLALASTDRITESDQYFEYYSGAWWAITVSRSYAQSTSSSPTVMSLKRKRVSGHTNGRLDESQETDVNGNITTVTTDVNRLTATSTTTSTTTGVARPAVQTSIVGLVVSSIDFAGLKTVTTYDSLLRKSTVKDSRNNIVTTNYVSGTSLVLKVTDATSTIVAQNGYDTSGRLVSQAGAPDEAVTGSPSHYTYSSYDTRGNLVRQWGDAALPVEYGYDPVFGERTTLKTYREGTGWTSTAWPTGSTDDADTTTWACDPSSGLLLSKTDAANRAVAYTYNPRGQLATRSWARGVVTTYAYDLATAEQRDILYSDGTPSLHYTYNRLGQPIQIEDATGARTQTHCVCGKLASEQLSYEFFGSRKLTYKLSQTAGTVLGRTLGYSLAVGSTVEMDLTYNYDPTSGRFADLSTHSTFVAADHQFRYAYFANSNLIEALSVDNAHPFTITRSFENQRDVMTAIDTKWSTTSRARYDYSVDKLGQRTSRTQSGDAFADYGDNLHQHYLYDGRGQLTSAKSYLGSAVDTAKILGDRQHEYGYDNIGNRESSNVTGNYTVRDVYTVNNLNQYTARENNYLSVSGTAASGVKVEVAGSGVLASGPGRYWSAHLTVTNVQAPWRGPVTVYSGKAGAGTSGADLVRTEARLATIGQDPQSFSYDLDGNLTTDGLWDYVWDAENRLIRLTATSAAVAAGFPNHRIEFTYDYLGRRVRKLVFDQSITAPISGRRFIYEGWNLVAEYRDSGTAIVAIVRSYTWGLDIARTLSDAGGVGALLQVSDHASGKAFFPAYDGNGNIVALFNGSSTSGALAAAYEYSPYGEPLRAQSLDTAVADQPFRFSTKYTDLETGLVYYGRRYYSPSQGRFLGRDPKKEKGGLNLFGFVQNNPVNLWDLLGMMTAYTWEEEWEVVSQWDDPDDEQEGLVDQYDWVGRWVPYEADDETDVSREANTVNAPNPAVAASMKYQDSLYSPKKMPATIARSISKLSKEERLNICGTYLADRNSSSDGFQKTYGKGDGHYFQETYFSVATMTSATTGTTITSRSIDQKGPPAMWDQEKGAFVDISGYPVQPGASIAIPQPEDGFSLDSYFLFHTHPIASVYGGYAPPSVGAELKMEGAKNMGGAVFDGNSQQVYFYTKGESGGIGEQTKMSFQEMRQGLGCK